jgi:hypothetical protein
VAELGELLDLLAELEVARDHVRGLEAEYTPHGADPRPLENALTVARKRVAESTYLYEQELRRYLIQLLAPK